MLNIETQIMGGSRMMLSLHVYVGYICIFSKEKASNSFVYDSIFAQKYRGKCCGAIIDNRYHALICVLEENI